MKDNQFCYWLMGLFELGEPTELSAKQVTQIKAHLSLVLKNTDDEIEIPFIFWLEGYMEGCIKAGFSNMQVNVIIDRLQRVFKHIIDPKASEHLQNTFNEIHHNNVGQKDERMRC